MLGISLGDCQVGSRRQGVEQQKRRKNQAKQEDNRDEEIKEIDPIKIEMDKVPLKDKFGCNECDKHFKRIDNLKRHKLKHTSDIEDSVLLSYSQDYELVESNDMLDEHLLREDESNSVLTKFEKSTTKKIFPCTDCGMTFSQEFKLAIHIKDNHQALTERDTLYLAASNLDHAALDSEKSYACVNCPKTFVNNRQRYKHNSRVHSGVTNSCDQCEKQFSRNDKLAIHKKSKHSNIYSEIIISCDECDKQFSRKDKLYTHKKNKHDM